MNNILTAVKANRSKIIKRVVIVGVVVTTIVVAGALYKANVDSKVALEAAEAALQN